MNLNILDDAIGKKILDRHPSTHKQSKLAISNKRILPDFC
jgi:hypothetical protein